MDCVRKIAVVGCHMSRAASILTMSSLVCLSALSAFAQNNGGQPPSQTPTAPGYFMSGPATSGAGLNGHPLLGGTAVLENEEVVTSPTGTAILARDQGGMVTLGHSSVAKVVVTPQQGSTLYLQDGLAAVYGVAPVQTPQGELKPGTPNTCYEVVAQPGKTFVMGISGTTQAQGQGNQTFTVQPNQAYVLQYNSTGQVVATPVAVDTVRTMVQNLQGDTTTKVQTASPVK